MRNKSLGFYLFVIVMLITDLVVIVPPILISHNQNDQIALGTYYAMSFACHQLDSRSLCYFPDSTEIIQDCTKQENNIKFQRSIIIGKNNETGYKLSVCARDTAIYFSMLIGAIAWALYYKKLDMKTWPSVKWLIVAMIPIAIDGTTQFLGFRESTNLLRMITGSIIGFAMAFYIIPTLNQILNSDDKKDE